MYPGQSGGEYNANVNKRQMAYHHNNRSDGTNRRNMYNTNNAYFACDVLNEIYAAGDDSNCVSDLYSCVRDESDVLFSVYLNSENKKYTASRDSECFTSLIVDENVVPKGNIRHDQTVVCQGLFQGVSKHGPNTKAARNTSANLAGNKSHQRNAKFRRETGDTGSADDAERGTHTRSQTPTRNAKGHQVHLQRVNGNAADGKFRGDLPRKHTAADNARDGVEARQSTDELMRASQGRKAQRDGTANYAYQTGDSGDGQTTHR